MAKIRIGVQLFSVREECARDLPGTLKALAEMGYEGVEFAGYYGRSPGELRDMLRELGLEVAGSHISVDTLMEDKLEETIRFNKELGNKYLIVPWLPEDMRNSRDAWLKTARFFNRVAERLKREGMYVGYHNHTEEFRKFDGETGWDIFAKATTHDVVLQVDVGNAMHGGLSMDEVLSIIRRYPGRIKTIHLKEYSRRDPNALLGEGEVRWRELIELCQKVGGTKWYIVEQETYRYPPLECVKRCLENLRKMIETL